MDQTKHKETLDSTRYQKMAESGMPEYPKALKQVLQPVGVQALKRAHDVQCQRAHQCVGVGGTLMDQTKRKETLDVTRYQKMAGSGMPD